MFWVRWWGLCFSAIALAAVGESEELDLRLLKVLVFFDIYFFVVCATGGALEEQIMISAVD